MGISCCPDRNFLCSSDLKDGILCTRVEYLRGNTLQLFCDYACHIAYVKLRDISPKIAKDQYSFYSSEVRKMMSFLQNKLELRRLVVYKVFMTGTKETENLTKNQKEVTSIEFYMNIECIRNKQELNSSKELIKYKYRWLKKNLFSTGIPIQEISFYSIDDNSLMETYS